LTTPYGAPVPSHSEAPLSINFRIPEVPGSPQLTVRASNGQELAGLTGDVAAAGVQVGRALVDFRSGFLAGAGLPAETASSTPASAQSAQTYQPQNPTAGYGAPAPDQQQYSMPAQQYGAPPQHQYAAPPQTGGMGAAPTCPHGQRVYKSGVSPKSGQPYKMWACPAPQGPEQCKPEWVK
jgi:hypothetical protein